MTVLLADIQRPAQLDLAHALTTTATELNDEIALDGATLNIPDVITNSGFAAFYVDASEWSGFSTSHKYLCRRVTSSGHTFNVLYNKFSQYQTFEFYFRSKYGATYSVKSSFKITSDDDFNQVFCVFIRWNTNGTVGIYVQGESLSDSNWQTKVATDQPSWVQNGNGLTIGDSSTNTTLLGWLFVDSPNESDLGNLVADPFSVFQTSSNTVEASATVLLPALIASANADTTLKYNQANVSSVLPGLYVNGQADINSYKVSANTSILLPSLVVGASSSVDYNYNDITASFSLPGLRVDALNTVGSGEARVAANIILPPLTVASATDISAFVNQSSTSINLPSLIVSAFNSVSIDETIASASVVLPSLSVVAVGSIDFAFNDLKAAIELPALRASFEFKIPYVSPGANITLLDQTTHLTLYDFNPTIVLR